MSIVAKSIVARFQQFVPLEPIPGLQHVWAVSGPVREVRRYYLALPDGQALFQVNARVTTDEGDLRRFLRFAQQHLPSLSNAAPMAAIGGLRLAHYGCDTAIGVLPAAAEFAPTAGRDREVDSRVYGLFPGWQCEASLTESEVAAFNRFRRRIDYANWEREPQPYLRVAYGYERSGAPDLRVENPVTVGFPELLSVFQEVAEAESGWAVCTNYTGKDVRIAFDRRLGLTWDAGKADVPVAHEEIRDRLWSFATTGR